MTMHHLPAAGSVLFGYLDDVTRALVLNTPWKDFLEWESLPLIKMAADMHGQKFWDDLAICYLGENTDRDDLLARVKKFEIPPVLASGVLVGSPAYENQGEVISAFRERDSSIRSRSFAWDEAFDNFDHYIKTCGAFGAYEAISVIQEYLNSPDNDPSIREYVALRGIEYLRIFSTTFFNTKSTLSFAAAGLKVSDFKEIGIDFETNTGLLAVHEFIKPFYENFSSAISPVTIAKMQAALRAKENVDPNPVSFCLTK